MIFPFLNGFLGWRKAPVTWLLFFLNLTVLIYTSLEGVEAQQGLEELMRKDYFVTTQGRVYAQYLKNHGEGQYSDFILQLGDQVQNGESDRAEMLGQLAFRDFAFLRNADQVDYSGDAVAFKLWKKSVDDVLMLQSQHPSFTLGMNAEDTGFSKWLSYIFVHSGWMHFAGNMLFLFIFGCALEQIIGGLGVLVVFLISGSVGAGVFALATGVTSSPLVGASGAVSGIMTLYCALTWNKPERYFYWLFLPLRGFMGFVWLPSWVALILWSVNDVAGYISTVPELGGVAHTAHLGGEVAGLMVGGVLFLVRRFWPQPKTQTIPTPTPPMGVLFPFLPHR